MAKKPQLPDMSGETIIQQPMEDVMHDSMLPYSEYVILERALPRVEDGLKPVQRRILYTMMELNLSPDKPHRKCARIVGDCLGKYHPHGDTSVYDALARMAQPFVMRGMLVDGHGNFGSIDGDSPAAMRYTEARMTPLALELLRDIDKETVPFRLNFDDSLKEPDMLPGRFPNLLVNGASGIAVGLATNIPPHNLREVISATIAQIDNPDITTKELMQYVKGPDFPTGGLIVESPELERAYEIGRGKLQVRARMTIEDGPAGRKLLVLTEMPYQVNKAALLERILKLSEEKKINGIYDIRDESDRTGMRAVIELKKDVDPERTLRLLYRYSDMQTTFGVNMVAIADGKPRQLGLKDALYYFIRHQEDVVRRRTQFDLDKARAREHILQGLIIAVDQLDRVIALIRASKNPKAAREGLMKEFNLTEIQAQAILDMRLQRLTNLEILELRREYKEIEALIGKLEGILKSEKKLLKVIKDELADIADKYGDDRRTQFIRPDAELPADEEEAPAPDPTTAILTRGGFFKRMPRKQFDKLMAQEDADRPAYLFDTDTAGKLLCFTDMGNCFTLPVSSIPDVKPSQRGSAPGGLLAGLESGENIVGVMELPAKLEGHMLLTTRQGMVKRTELSQFSVRGAKFAAIKLREGDSLIAVRRLGSEKNLLMITAHGMSIAFTLDEVNVTGRVGMGVRGISLGAGDECIAALPFDPEGEVLLISDCGYMKRCLLVDFDMQSRGGKGTKCFALLKSGANGSRLVGALPVRLPYDFTVTQQRSGDTKLNTEEIKIESRAAKGTPYVAATGMDPITEVRPIIA